MTHRISSKLRKELSASEKQRFGAPTVGVLFNKFNSGINEIWEDHIALTVYMHEIHKQIKTGTVERLKLPRLVRTPSLQPLSQNAIYGIINRIRIKRCGMHAFIDGVSLFEQFMSSLVFNVYVDYPRKLMGLSRDGAEAESRRLKLIEVIFESSDRDEMIHKLVEEKVRSIFYGNPLDLFAGNRADIGFGTYFKDNHPRLLEAFREITARRNIIIHNEARVDRKYRVEVPGTKLKLGQSVDISQEYLRVALLVMKDLAASAAQCVATNVYKEPLVGRAKRVQEAAVKEPIV